MVTEDLQKKILAKAILPKYLTNGHSNLKLIRIDLKMERAGENRTLKAIRGISND
jgi:hypothetical protein